MTSLPAQRRDFARQTSVDDEMSIGPDVALPDLPVPGPAGRVILALFEGEGWAVEHEIEILIGPGLRLH